MLKINLNKMMEADTGLGGTPSVDNGDNTIVAPANPTVEPSEDESEPLNKDIENIKNKLDIVYECLIDLYENPSKNGKPKDKPVSLINWNTYNEKIEEIPTEPEVIPEDNGKK